MQASIKTFGKLLKDDQIWAYFVHSYRINPKDSSIIKATADYGIQVPAIVESGLLYGNNFILKNQAVREG